VKIDSTLRSGLLLMVADFADSRGRERNSLVERVMCRLAQPTKCASAPTSEILSKPYAIEALDAALRVALGERALSG
jgi:hypothetical protein